MRGNQSSFEPRYDEDLDREDRLGHAPPSRDDDVDVAEDADRYQRIAYRPNPLPAREEEEEEIAEADIMEILDDDDLDKMEGPDA